MLRSFYKIETEITKAIRIHTEGSAFHSADEDGLVCTSEQEKTVYKETTLQQHRDWTDTT